jgi:membrane-associated phospholipid phosphatase
MLENPEVSPATFWLLFTRLGEAQLLLPLALAGAAWLAWHGGQAALARRWLLALAAAVALTTASKLAFMGWGLGLAAWDFTGFSGHAMCAAAVLPVLAWMGLRGRPWGYGLGLGLAALIAFSRVQVSAHSLSEALSGLVLGAAVSLWALQGQFRLRLVLPAWLPAGALALLLLAPVAAPRARTHDWVTQLSLQLSGREQPYTRLDLQHRLPSINAKKRLAPA